MKENHALLISGDESRFIEEVNGFQDYLIDEAGFDPSKIRIIMCTYAGNGYITEETRGFLEKAKDWDAVIIYNGHGGRGSLTPNRTSLTYKEWSDAAIDFPSRIFFINNSCFSGSCMDDLDAGAFRRGLTLTSSDEEEPSYGDVFLQEMISEYRKMKPFKMHNIGGHYVLGKIMLENPDNPESLRFNETYIPFEYPLAIGNVQHPKRRGIVMDHILYPAGE